MTITLLLEQVFNGIQSGVTLFLVAAGLTLVLGMVYDHESLEYVAESPLCDDGPVELLCED